MFMFLIVTDSKVGEFVFLRVEISACWEGLKYKHHAFLPKKHHHHLQEQ